MRVRGSFYYGIIRARGRRTESPAPALENMQFVYTAPRYHTNQHFVVKALQEAGHSVSFLVLRQGHTENYEALQPCVLGYSATFAALQRLIRKLPRVTLENAAGMPSPFTFWREMRRLRPSVVVVRDPFSAYGLLSMIVTKILRGRLILYVQTPMNRNLPWWKRFVLKFTAALTGGKWMTPVHGPSAPDDPDTVILNYVPFVIPAQTHPEAKRWFDSGTVNILSVGKYEYRKNHRLLLDALHRLSQRYRIRATLVGECADPDSRRDLERVKMYRKQLGLDDIVDIEVNLSFSDLQRRYAENDLFVLPSRDELAAVSPLEAMSHSLPVVCSDTNGTECYIRPGENGFVFRTDDLDDLEACLAKIVGDRGKLMQMGRRSHELTVFEHAPNRYVEAVMTLAGAADVAIYMPSLEGGGAERAMLDVARGIAQRGLRVDMVLIKAKGPYIELLSDGVRLVDLNAKRALTSLYSFTRYLLRERPTVVVSTLPEVNVMTLMMKKLFFKRVIVVARRANNFSMEYRNASAKDRVVLNLEKRLLSSANAVVVNSRGVEDDLKQIAPRISHLIRVIHNPVVWPDHSEKAGSPVTHEWFRDSDLPVIVSVGRLAPSKGHATLLEAFAELRKSHPARLVLLGEGPERSNLVKLAQTLNIYPDVDFIGFHINPFAYMSKARVFVLPSHYEGFPNSLAQAMACGTPVVSTDCPSGPREILEDGKWGRLVPVGDPRALADATIETLRSPIESSLLVSRSRAYSAETSIDRYMEVLANVAN